MIWGWSLAKRQYALQRIPSDITPVFNFEYLSFIFNHYTGDSCPSAWRDRPGGRRCLLPL